MSVKLRVSYLHQQELDDFIKLVKPFITKIKKVKPADTQYYKAYITLKSAPTNATTYGDFKGNY